MVINARVLPHVRFNFVDICFVIVIRADTRSLYWQVQGRENTTSWLHVDAHVYSYGTTVRLVVLHFNSQKLYILIIQVKICMFNFLLYFLLCRSMLFFYLFLFTCIIYFISKNASL